MMGLRFPYHIADIAFALRKKEIKRRKDTEMAKANNNRAISLTLVLMLCLLIFISMAESRILSGKSYITALTDLMKKKLNSSHHYPYTNSKLIVVQCLYFQLFILTQLNTLTYFPICVFAIWTTAKQSTPQCDTIVGVESEDTCLGIAEKFQLTIDFFHSINLNLNCIALFVGQRVCVDGTAN